MRHSLRHCKILHFLGRSIFCYINLSVDTYDGNHYTKLLEIITQDKKNNFELLEYYLYSSVNINLLIDLLKKKQTRKTSNNNLLKYSFHKLFNNIIKFTSNIRAINRYSITNPSTNEVHKINYLLTLYWVYHMQRILLSFPLYNHRMQDMVLNISIRSLVVLRLKQK